MRILLRFLILTSLAALLAGCAEMNLLLGELDDDLASRPQPTARRVEEQTPARTQPLEVEKPRPAPPRAPRNELDRLPKIEPLEELMGSDAADVLYFSGASVERIVAFYRRELPPLGWREGKGHTDNRNYATLKFAKGKELLTLSLGLESDSKPPRVFVNLVPHGTLRVAELPRYPGTQTLFEEEYTAIYVTPDPVDRVFHKSLQLLQQAGWRQERTSGDSQNRHAQMVKGELLLDMMVGVAPAQGNKTTIQYGLRKKAET